MDPEDLEMLRSAPPVTLDVPVCRALDQTIALRAQSDAGDGVADPLGTMVGHFSVFGEWYEINSWFEGHFVERLEIGAFKRTIKNRSGQSPIRVLLEHGFDPVVGDKPLGVPDVLEERDNGPYAETPLLDTSYNRDLAPALAAGAYGQSFRFQVMRDEFVEPGGEGFDESVPKKWADLPQRTITEVRLIEFGPTVFPASPATNSTTGLRSTTDSFYERLRRRDPTAYDDAVARSQTLRAPQTPDADPAPGQPEDPQPPHPEDPPADEVEHSEGPQGEHSEVDTPASTPPERKTVMDPMTIEERTARQSEIRARLAEIDSEFAGGAMDEESRSEWDELNTEYDQHEVAIADAQRRQERIRALADNPDATVQVVRPAQGTRTGGGSRPENIYDLAEIRNQARSIDDLPRLMRDNAMRAVEQARFPGVSKFRGMTRERAQERVAELLDTVDDDNGTLARRVLTTGSPTYLRAFGKMLANGGLTAEEQRALSLGTDADGGFAVPFQLDPTVILTSDGVEDPLRAIARVEQIVGKEWQGITSAGVSIGRSGEATESDDDSFTIDQEPVKATRVDAFVPFSLEIEADWSRMQAEITRVLADAKMTEEAGSFINGTGVAPQPEGLLTGTTQDVPTVGANAFADDDLYALEEALPERWLANATFLAHRSFYNAVRQLGAAGDGGNLWVRLADGLPPELIGYPARRQSELPSFNAAADQVLAVFGDYRQFLIVDRVGMSVELVPHLIGANRRPTGQRGVYAYWRNASKVLVDGAFRRLLAHTV
jgi:HK97 family phage major capsid protein